MDAIDVQHIVKRFGDFTAVDGITFNVRQGEIFGLLGPNGAGKSTLIRMLTTLIPPTEGTAIVGGADVSRTKRDIKTFEVRLRADNKDRKLAVGLTAYVLLPLGR